MTKRNTECQARHDTLETRVLEAIATVNDPEYPDVSIVDLGLLQNVNIGSNVAMVGLMPTFSGCPALRMIGDDVTAAVEAVDGIERCIVTWLTGEVWSTDRMSATARDRLAAEYTVIVRADDGGLRCPVCGSSDVVDQSMAGPTRCRSVAWCPSCRNPVEVMRMDAVPVPVADPRRVGSRGQQRIPSLAGRHDEGSE